MEAPKEIYLQSYWMRDEYDDWGLKKQSDDDVSYIRADLIELTPEDVGLIFNKVRELQVKYSATEGCYQEVAEWFNKQRNK